MAIVVLKGRPRQQMGKGAARRARRSGVIPGIIYGVGEASIPFEAGYDDFQAMIHTASGENVIVDLKLEGDPAERKAIIRDIQRDPLSGQILHFDLHHISLTERVTVDVPIHVVGIPIGVKDFGGILEHILREVEVECLPTEIPTAVEVNVSHLKIGDSVHVGELVVENVKVLTDADRPVVTVVPPVVEEVPKEVEVPEAEEPELVGKEKEEEEKEAEQPAESKGKGKREKEGES
ncbi:MAG: 50S ribosomal protein L25 [Candidatus Eiseniibacteriota bacterium]|nr:MAG: 50S ribosomal protein L25 [Candidatus Eisenbacteria bacterium]